MMCGEKKIFVLISVISFIAGVAVAYGFYYQNWKQVNELRYLDRTIDLKWHITMLKELRNNQVGNVIGHHEKLIETTLIELSGYSEDSTGEYRDQIIPVIDVAKSYKKNLED